MKEDMKKGDSRVRIAFLYCASNLECNFSKIAVIGSPAVGELE